ncbi:hypothetical protein HK099_005201 [Clydaea vesicula]|uniref:Uncharacterized protein n=1 Tax=Clydaea vesicula TaxID=447962 RepID=A0AAD5U0L9_9FUNG|nr:hypothetical protein HK099_005201 [Clydaea vesicula]
MFSRLLINNVFRRSSSLVKGNCSKFPFSNFTTSKINTIIPNSVSSLSKIRGFSTSYYDFKEEKPFYRKVQNQLPKSLRDHLARFKESHDEIHLINAIKEADEFYGKGSILAISLKRSLADSYLYKKNYESHVEVLVSTLLEFFNLHYEKIYKLKSANPNILDKENAVSENPGKKNINDQELMLIVKHLVAIGLSLSHAFIMIMNVDAAALILEWNIRLVLGYPVNPKESLEKIVKNTKKFRIDTSKLSAEKLQQFDRNFKTIDNSFFGETKEDREKNFNNYKKVFLASNENINFNSQFQIFENVDFKNTIRSVLKNEGNSVTFNSSLPKQHYLSKIFEANVLKPQYLPEDLKAANPELTRPLILSLFHYSLVNEIKEPWSKEQLQLLSQISKLGKAEEELIKPVMQEKIFLTQPSVKATESYINLARFRINFRNFDFEKAQSNVEDSANLIKSLDKESKLGSKKDIYHCHLRNLINYAELFLAKGDKKNCFKYLKLCRETAIASNQPPFKQLCEGYIKILNSLEEQ